MVRFHRALWLWFAYAFLFTALSFGDIAPTTGTFRGIYHRDRSGVGRFSTMIVHKSLRSKLDKYDGKLIQVEVTKGDQPSSFWPAIMLEVGKIVELPAAPVSITAETIPLKVGANESFQVLAKVHNGSDSTVDVWPGPMRISAIPTPDPRYRWAPFGSGYKDDDFMSRREYPFRSAMCSVPMQKRHIIGHPSEHIGSIPVRPGESYPLVLVFDEGLAKGEYEAEVNVSVSIDNKSVPVSAWLEFDVGGKSKASPKAKSDLSLKMSDVEVKNQWKDDDGTNFKRPYKWFLANLTLTNNGSSDRKLPLHSNAAGRVLWQGRVFGWSSDGKRIPMTFHYYWIPWSAGFTAPDSIDDYDKDKYEVRSYGSGLTSIRIPWRLGTIKPSGRAEYEIRFRPLSYFPDSPIERITCDLLTDEGLETFVLEDSFEDSLFVEPPAYGSETSGIKCRIRTEFANYKRGEDIAVFLNVANMKERPVSTISTKGWEDKWTVEIDGKKVEGLKVSIDRGTIWHTPYGKFSGQYYIRVDSSKISAGKHTVRVLCDGDGKTFRNMSEDIIRDFKGKLVSNLWEFRIDRK